MQIHSFVCMSAFFVSCLAISATISAEEVAAPNSSHANGVIDLFEAIEQELVSVQFIPSGSDRANIVFRNHTNAPIDLDLPKAFGAVHVHGQLGGFNGGGNGAGNAGAFAGQGGAAGAFAGGQNLGGGFGNGNGVNGGGGGFGFGGGNGGAGNFQGGNFAGGGLFRVKADQSRRVAVNTVCLQHGRPDPNPRMAYKIVPLKDVCENEMVADLCALLGTSRIEQKTAQAVAWHIANGISWPELANLNESESRYTGNNRRFTLAHIQAAQGMVELWRTSQSSSESTHSAQEANNTPAESPESTYTSFRRLHIERQY